MTPRQMYGKGLAFPMRVGDDGRVAWSDGVPNVEECIRIILSTEPGERLFRPDFGAGLRSFLFQPNTVTTRHQISERIKRALARWEPRIQVERVDVLPDPADPEAAIATLHYRLVATQAPMSLMVGVRLGA
jgi:uncharacterized protein